MITFGAIKFNSDEVSDLENVMLNKVNKGRVSTGDILPNDDCLLCSKDDIYVWLSLDNRKSTLQGFCKECVSEVLEEVRRTKKLIDDIELHVGESGFSIIDWSGANKTKTDFIDGDKIENDIVIVINTKKNDIVTRLRNIDTLVDVLGKESSLINEDSMKFDTNCGMCGNNNIVEYIDGSSLCNDCRAELSSELETYFDENKKDIVSKTI